MITFAFRFLAVSVVGAALSLTFVFVLRAPASTRAQQDPVFTIVIPAHIIDGAVSAGGMAEFNAYIHAYADGMRCATVNLVNQRNPATREAVIEFGREGQPPECSRPGARIVLLSTYGHEYFVEFQIEPGGVRQLTNLAPKPPHSATSLRRQSIGGVIRLDSNDNGIADPGERAPPARIELHVREDSGHVWRKAVTPGPTADDFGFFLVEPHAGEYSVVVYWPGGFTEAYPRLPDGGHVVFNTRVTPGTADLAASLSLLARPSDARPDGAGLPLVRLWIQQRLGDEIPAFSDVIILPPRPSATATPPATPPQPVPPSVGDAGLR